MNKTTDRDRKAWSPVEPPGCRVAECPNLATYCTNHRNRARIAIYAARNAVETYRAGVSR